MELQILYRNFDSSLQISVSYVLYILFVFIM